jgi:protein-L-isoaspartate(D-aspartate) O-methyltransferase
MTWKPEQEYDEVIYAAQRDALLAEVSEMAAEINPRYGAPPISTAVLEAMRRVPRHRFVPEDQRRYAYLNQPLAIGHGQTISQPYIVALMTDLLELKAGERVLEVGTGCGYQAAVLAEMGVEVYSVEIVTPLAHQAAARLEELGYHRVQVQATDGARGWPEHAPYDAIIVTAGAGYVPQALVAQLRLGGRMVIPLGAAWSSQELLLIRKDKVGNTNSQEIIPVRFVPLTGEGEK